MMTNKFRRFRIGVTAGRMFVVIAAMAVGGCRPNSSPVVDSVAADSPVDSANQAVPVTPAAAGEQADLGVPREQITYNEVAPIVWEKCSCCHREGEAAPFSLIQYSDFAVRLQQVRDVMDAHFMPPWLPNTPDVRYENDTRLTGEQKQRLFAWLDAGAPEGDPASVPTVPSWTRGWQLGPPDLIVSAPEAFQLPSSGTDVYRNFVIPIPTDRVRYVRAMEFRPGNYRVVHHAFMMIDASRRLRRLCNLDGQPGFGGMDTGEATSPGGHFIGWQPGRRPHVPPEDMAWKLVPGTDLVLQVHMQCTGKPEQLQPSVGLFFTEQIPTRNPVKILLRSVDIDIPAGQSDYEIQDEFQLPVAVDLMAVAPHAHYLGKEMVATAEFPGGETKVLMSIPDWDLNWQSEYRFAETIHLPAGTVLKQRFTYDNSENNVRNPHHPPQRVRYGPQASDEMGSVWFQVLVSDPAQRPRLLAAIMQKGLRTSLRLNRQRVAEDPQDVNANLQLGKISLTQGQFETAVNYFRTASQADPKSSDALYYWGQTLLRSGHSAEGIGKLERCVELDPEYFRAYHDMGYAAYLKKDFGNAERWFREALNIQPYDVHCLKQLANSLLAQGKKKEAITSLRDCLGINPEEQQIRDFLYRIDAPE